MPRGISFRAFSIHLCFSRMDASEFISMKSPTIWFLTLKPLHCFWGRLRTTDPGVAVGGTSRPSRSPRLFNRSQSQRYASRPANNVKSPLARSFLKSHVQTVVLQGYSDISDPVLAPSQMPSSLTAYRLRSHPLLPLLFFHGFFTILSRFNS